MKSFFSDLMDNMGSNSKIICDGKEFTCSQFISQVRKFAYILQECPQKEILLNVKNDYMTLAAILAIWQSGKVYIPISESINEVAKVRLRKKLQNYVEVSTGYDYLVINAEKKVTGPESDVIQGDNDDVYYIIFTSGTTGEPKGVEITGNNIQYLLQKANDYFSFKSDDVWINLHDFSFDFAIWEILAPLFYGANLVLPGQTKLYEFDKVEKLIKNHQVTILNQTPSAFYILQKYLNDNHSYNNIRYVIFGGERLETRLIEDSYKKWTHTQFINMYGITEITVHATFHLINKDDFQDYTISNIGKGLSCESVVLVDDKRQPITSGTGEIAVIGGGVAKGYYQIESHDNFVHKTVPTYFSGDLGTYLPNGDINYLYRKDKLVKHNGYRINLNEIKNSVLSIPQVDNCCIAYEEDKIGCFYTTDSQFSPTDLIAGLKQKLEDYKLPNLVYCVESLPINKNGKVDTKTLFEQTHSPENAPAHDSVNEAYSDFKSFLFQHIKDKYNLTDVSSDSSFFELGMTSLDLINLHLDINKIFKSDKSFQVAHIFEFYTINMLEQHFSFERK